MNSPYTDKLAMKIFELTYENLVEELARKYGKGEYHATAIFRQLYGRMNTDMAASQDMAASGEFASLFCRAVETETGRVVRKKEQEGVVKFVTRFSDGIAVESVVISMVRHKTVCVSTQAGCRMGCRFCETAKEGLSRNLTVQEIVGQVYAARKNFGSDVRNIVFMGMGEPFDNYDNVIQSIDVVSDQRGLNIARRRITVSTAGLEAGLKKFAADGMPHVKLAVSLNASNDRLRSELMPVNRAFPMDKLRKLLLGYPLKKKDTFMIAYVQIPGVNDRPEHVLELAQYLALLPAKVNLIPFNPGTDSLYRPPTAKETETFRDLLIEKRVNIQKRTTKGKDLMAACGQLGGEAGQWELPGPSNNKIL